MKKLNRAELKEIVGGDFIRANFPDGSGKPNTFGKLVSHEAHGSVHTGICDSATHGFHPALSHITGIFSDGTVKTLMQQLRAYAAYITPKK